MEETAETNESVFRTRVAPSPETFNTAGYQKSDKTPDSYESEEGVKPSEYVKTNRPPLVVDLLGVRMALGKFAVKEHSLEIDQYLNSEIERQKIADTRDNYEKLINSALKKINLEGEQNEFTKLEKLHEYAVAQTKLWEAIKENEELTNGDPLDMPLPKMRKALELRYGTPTR